MVIAILTYKMTGEPIVTNEAYIKNKRMLSIGKLSLSPNFEHTPKALSSKNIFSFSIIVDEYVAVNLGKSLVN
ncbi:hypothetical protein LV84_00667 [Algoriphagus ratkowskyi]|uniref:Uncharacterized protein n=1 Tax=Algoriphagus ratkowskyi TaxID=57028 RepID=A0A2W7RJG5_9BACT|nr:hypothetical protein LV84_00667 [Algoriphagus ratkowskyi]